MTRTTLQLRGSPQADAFRLQPGESMRYVLLLNGVLPSAPQGRTRAEREASLRVHLQTAAPDALPDPHGPISLVLVL